MKLDAVTVVLLKNSWLRAEKNLSQQNINFYNERDEKRISSVFWFIFTLNRITPKQHNHLQHSRGVYYGTTKSGYVPYFVYSCTKL